MKEKIRVLTEGRRIVLIIEDTTEGDLSLLQKVIGEIAFHSLDSVTPNESREIPVPHPADIPDIDSADTAEENAVQEEIPVVEEETVEEIESEEADVTDYEPIIMSKGRFKGKTLEDIMKADPSYVHWMVDKNHNEFKWEDFEYFKSAWADLSKTCDIKNLIFMIRTLDKKPDAKVNIESEIGSALGIEKLEELSNEIDINFAREIVEGALV